MASFYWYDLETFGLDSKRDRIAQFAGQRTDLDMQPVGDPEVHYVRLSGDYLPDPQACLITGIGPTDVDQKGLRETESLGRIESLFSEGDTCVVGYNNIRFDDEFIRFGFYRDLRDPYAREWRNGNSRWDLLDVVRLAYALRPAGIEWPTHENGMVSFKLEHLTEVNHLSHDMAHDALSDVQATIEVAKLLHRVQPKLFHFAYQYRTKKALKQLLEQQIGQPLVHVSGRYPVTKGCMALIAPLCVHPQNPNAIIAFDLAYDESDPLTYSHEEIAERIFTAVNELPEEVERLPIKAVHLNRSPILVPLNVLDPTSIQRWNLNLDQAQSQYLKVKSNKYFIQRVQQVFREAEFEPEMDPETMLYSGDFFKDQDKRTMAAIHRCDPGKLNDQQFSFQDSRLEELYFRWRARNYPHSLSNEDQRRWQAFRQARLIDGDDKKPPVSEYIKRLKSLLMETESSKSGVLTDLLQYAQQLGIEFEYKPRAGDKFS